eukprot:jgi/Chlat1/2178/Chrsp17S02854
MEREPVGDAAAASQLVLGASVTALYEWHNEMYRTNLKLADFHSYQYWEVWGGTRQEAIAKVREWYNSGHFANLGVVEGSVSTLQALSQQYDFVVVTSRQAVIEERSRQWIEKHFPGVFKAVYFGNHYAAAGEPAHHYTKAEMCKEARAVALVDDNQDYCMECAEAGIQAFLFDLGGNYLWSRRRKGVVFEDLPPGVMRVTSWHEVQRHLMERLKNEQPHSD